METTVYFSSKRIVVTKTRTNAKTGQVVVSQSASAPTPDGAVLNGVITDEERLLEAFSGIKGEIAIHATNLVLDTSHIYFRLSVLPKASANDMAKLVRNEFANKNISDEKYIFDYSYIKDPQVSPKQRLVLCCAVERAIINSFKDFFKKAGVKLNKIDFSTNAMLQVLSARTDVFARRSAIICVVDHYILSVISIPAKGEIFFSRSRIISPEVDQGYFNEIEGILFTYTQGRKSADSTADTSALDFYILDSNAKNLRDYEEMAKRLNFKSPHAGLGALVKLAGDTKDAAACAYNICSVSAKPPKQIDFSHAREIRSVSPKTKRVAAMALPAALVLGSLVFYCVGTRMEISSMRGEISDINAYLNSALVRDSIAAYAALNAERLILTDRLGQYRDYGGYLAESISITSAEIITALDILQKGGSCKQTTFSADGGALVFLMETDDPMSISESVATLRDSGLFEDVSYSGYQSAGKDQYDYTVTCILGGALDE